MQLVTKIESNNDVILKHSCITTYFLPCENEIIHWGLSLICFISNRYINANHSMIIGEDTDTPI